MKLNCDGAVSNLGIMAAIEGCVRDENNVFLIGFLPPLVPILFLVTSNHLLGIKLALIKEFKFIDVESDSQATVKLIQSRCSS